MYDSYKMICQLLEDKTIEGRNLGSVEKVSFDLLTKRFGSNEETIRALEYLQNQYFSFYEELSSSNSIITPIVTEDGLVKIEPGTPFHRCIPKLSTLKNISIGGLLASEWFGIPESELEGAFCSFINTIIGENDKTILNSYVQNKLASTSMYGDCVLYFDSNNPVMQKLLQMDFFKYAKSKNDNPNEYKNEYSPELVDLFEKVIYPLSPAGIDMHEIEGGRTYYWRAIPGGIPPQLINGICINSKQHKDLLENISIISSLFPNATIFDETKKVLVYPQEREQQNNKTL